MIQIKGKNYICTGVMARTRQGDGLSSVYLEACNEDGDCLLVGNPEYDAKSFVGPAELLNAGPLEKGPERIAAGEAWAELKFKPEGGE